jgi:hypothetical protein
MSRQCGFFSTLLGLEPICLGGCASHAESMGLMIRSSEADRRFDRNLVTRQFRQTGVKLMGIGS